MQRNKIIIALMICVLIVLVGCTTHKNRGRSSQIDIIVPEDNTREITLPTENTQETTQPVEEYNACETEDFTKLDAYYFPIFEEQGSPEYCRPNSKRDCYSNMCYTKYNRYVVWKKDIEICENLDISVESYWRDRCIYELSLFTFERDICNKLSSEELKAACLMSKENTEGYGIDRALYYAENWFERCSSDPTREYVHDLDNPPMLTEEHKAECGLKVLDYLKNDYDKECSDEFCVFFRSFDPTDITSCEIVPEYIEDCVKLFIHSTDVSGDICNKLTDPDTCIEKVAIKNSDVELCMSLDYEPCLDEIAVNNVNLDICFEHTDYFFAEMCVNNYAYKLSDLTACNDERYPGDVIYCEDRVFERLSTEKDDVEYCYKQRDQEDIYWCVAMYAGHSKNESVCHDERYQGDTRHCTDQARSSY